MQEMPNIVDQRIRCNKQQAKMIHKLYKDKDAEILKQLDILYNATAIALGRKGWRQERLNKLVNVTHEVYSECGYQSDMSMVEFCARELGIHLIPEDSKIAWDESQIMSSEIEINIKDAWQYIQMLRTELKWIPTQITACLLVAMHRKEGWGAQRCGELFMDIEDVKQEYHLNIEDLRAEAKKMTGFELTEGLEV